MKKNLLLFIIFIMTNSCSGFSDAAKVLRNEKIRTTDEFLIEKKEPLILPPDYEVIPEPGTLSKKENTDQKKIKTILNTSEKGSNNMNSSSSTEESILKQIRK